MKKIFFVSVSFLLINYGCDVNDSLPQIKGTYEGTYYLTQYVGSDSSYTRQCFAKVEFTDRTYKCESDSYFVLPGGIGRYSINYTTLTFTDTIPHRADIDPDFLLTGKFKYTMRGSNLLMNQDNKYRKFYRQLNLEKKK